MHLFQVPKSPIYIAGVPRSGTSWLASILNTSRSVKYFCEPFNPLWVPEAVPHVMKYMRAGDNDPSFSSFCQQIFSGQLKNDMVYKKLAQPYRAFGNRLRCLPGRVIVKDVHSLMSLAWMQENTHSTILIIIRHPCAVAASWFQHFNLEAEFQGLYRIACQASLIEDYLNPYQHLFDQAADFWQKIAVYWGAVYHVILQQKRKHSNWIIVRHEDLCLNPVQSFKQLFDQLELCWTKQTDNLLDISTSQDSGKPYSPFRISAEEPNKWRKRLEPWQIEKISYFTQPFNIPYYADFQAG